MSIPIRRCRLVEAADDIEKFNQLHRTMKKNLDGGHFTVHSCKHHPPCRELSKQEQIELFARFKQRPAKMIR